MNTPLKDDALKRDFGELEECGDKCVCVFSKMCAGPTQRPVRAGPCCPAGTLTARRAAVLSLSTAAAEATGITLSQRSTACLSAAASVSPDLDRQLARSECRSFQSLVCL